MESIRLASPRTVTGDGVGLVSRGGLVWLAETADLCGLTAGLDVAFAGVPGRVHRPGRTIAQVVLGLADGATALAGIARARASARERAWAAGAGPDGEVLVIDIDASIVRTRADKQDAAATYKRTYGHHPLLAMAGDCDEVLAGIMRPGNAGSNTAADHITVLGEAIAALPAAWRSGHDQGDHPDDAAKELIVRADSAGAAHWLAEHCTDRNIGFSIGYAIDERVRNGLCLVDDDTWIPATDGNGAERPGAEVVELTDLVELAAWPAGTRLIVRREIPHPGAQLTLFDTIEGRRHTAFITDQTDDDIAGLELFQRRRARAENVIRDTKACGLANLPFDDIVNNETWMQLCFAAHDLLVRARYISLTGQLRRATPKTIRHRLLHVAARVTPGRRRLDLDRTWPWTTTLLDAIHRLRHAFTSPTVTGPASVQAAL